jgi:hypothetical protein
MGLASNAAGFLRFVCPVSKLQLDWAKPDDVTVSKRRLRFDSRATDRSAVCAFEILQHGASSSAVNPDTRMPARHIRIIQPDAA